MSTNSKNQEETDWRNNTRSLNYAGHDIRIIIPKEIPKNLQQSIVSPAVFGDFSPNPDDPDPDIWPLKNHDPGYGEYDIEDLECLTSTFPAPHVAWVTPEYLENKYGYDPFDPYACSVNKNHLGKPDGFNETSEITLTHDRVEAFRRIARLWNGEEVQGMHLLDDKLPSWESLLSDLNQEDINRLITDPKTPDEALVEAFGDHSWLDTEGSPFFTTQWIVRNKVRYSPSLKARTLINGREELPELNGDPKEGLTHRFTVGLVAAVYHQRGYDVKTYEDYNGYVVDVIAEKDEGRLFFEIITGHNNYELHRSTYRKLSDLRSDGGTITVFDTRETAYNIFNHYHRRDDLGELPLGTFETDQRIAQGRDKINEAFHSGIDWDIYDWFTTTTAWDFFSRADINRESLLSLKW